MRDMGGHLVTVFPIALSRHGRTSHSLSLGIVGNCTVGVGY